MSTLIITFFALLIVIAGMAIGVMMGRQPLKGSCGGVGKALGEEDYVCDLCGNDEAKCEEINANTPELLTAGNSNNESIQQKHNDKKNAASQSDLAYDASKK